MYAFVGEPMDKGDPDGDLAGQGPQQWHGLAGDLLLAQLGESSAQDPGEDGECEGGPNLERTQAWQEVSRHRVLRH